MTHWQTKLHVFCALSPAEGREIYKKNTRNVISLLRTTSARPTQKVMVKLFQVTSYKRVSEPGYESANFSVTNTTSDRVSHRLIFTQNKLAPVE